MCNSGMNTEHSLGNVTIYCFQFIAFEELHLRFTQNTRQFWLLKYLCTSCHNHHLLLHPISLANLSGSQKYSYIQQVATWCQVFKIRVRVACKWWMVQILFLCFDCKIYSAVCKLWVRARIQEWRKKVFIKRIHVYIQSTLRPFGHVAIWHIVVKK